MRVYFVRHGQTEYNKKHIHQTANIPLAPEGIAAARKTGEHLQESGIGMVLSSNILRAEQTAAEIGNALGVSVVKTGILREIGRPSSIWGTSHFHPRTFWYVISTILNRKKAKWHHKDAESLYEINSRAGEARRILEGLSTEHDTIVVVSHAIFLEILLTFICKKCEPRLIDYVRMFSPFSKIKNTSISEFEYTPGTDEHCGWEMISYNNTEHLKE